MTISHDWRQAELLFTPLDEYARAIDQLRQAGARRFLLEPGDSTLAAQLNKQFGSSIVLSQDADAGFSCDAVVIPPLDPGRLSAELFSYIDRPARLIAPITNRYIANQPLFVVTIPKSGTHLLYYLLDSFGIQSGGMHQDALRPGTYHFLFYPYPHLPAALFVAQLALAPRGGGGHPFFSTPTLFTYRNPLDILVSEVFYVVKRDKSALAYFYEDLPASALAMALIRGDPLLPPLAGRVMQFAPWMRLKNVIPLCFEELVGSRGGGSDDAQARAIWSLQLKLHAPGSPLAHGGRIYTEKSATFRKGRINDHRQFLGPEHYAEIRDLSQDFMHEFGYDLDDDFREGYLPRLVDTFRRRPLQLDPPLASIPPGPLSEEDSGTTGGAV